MPVALLLALPVRQGLTAARVGLQAPPPAWAAPRCVNTALSLAPSLAARRTQYAPNPPLPLAILPPTAIFNLRRACTALRGAPPTLLCVYPAPRATGLQKAPPSACHAKRAPTARQWAPPLADSAPQGRSPPPLAQAPPRPACPAPRGPSAPRAPPPAPTLPPLAQWARTRTSALVPAPPATPPRPAP